MILQADIHQHVPRKRSVEDAVQAARVQHSLCCSRRGVLGILRRGVEELPGRMRGLCGRRYLVRAPVAPKAGVVADREYWFTSRMWCSMILVCESHAGKTPGWLTQSRNGEIDVCSLARSSTI